MPDAQYAWLLTEAEFDGAGWTVDPLQGSPA
jgi:hypothetical protein